MKFLRILCAVLIIAGLTKTEAADAAPTETLYLSGTDKDQIVPWRFFCTSGRNSGVWTTIGVPSNWETRGFGTYVYGNTTKEEEKGLYKTNFTPPAKWRGKQVFIVFEGSMTDTEVSINGVSAGAKHQGGFYRFRYDVTPLIQWGQPNLLEVMVSKDSSDDAVNRAERKADYWVFGGIYRPVYLEAVPAQSIERSAIHARADGTFAADVFLRDAVAGTTLTAQISTLDGQRVGPVFSQPIAAATGKVTLQTRINNPRRWSAETPALYQVELRLMRGRAEIHRTTQRFGFRTIEVRAGDGLYLNGRKIVLKGVSRHSFWPDSGRTTSPTLNRADILLMKEMNMNAVRMSHYPPDADFLDSADELGLYVLDELAGWHGKYDTAIGKKLVRATLTRDVNHPSILLWDNGNEGGWNTDLDDEFARYDPQQRAVLHPWTTFRGIDTSHYKSYDETRRRARGTNIFLPTEFLHGLYDGGAGAGLDDYWDLMSSQPQSAGGFLWVFSDEGLVRLDRNGAIDTNGNRAPDGIVGPYRQKEASFYTVKEIWSPLQIANRDYYARVFPANFNGKIAIANSYSFTNASQCTFAWQLLNFAAPSQKQVGATVAARGTTKSPDIAPGARGFVELDLPANWRTRDALALTATDPKGRTLYTWVWPIKKAADFANRIVQPARGTVAASEDAASITMTAGQTSVAISKSTGRLLSVKHDGAKVSLTNGPTLAAGEATFVSLTQSRAGQDYVVQANHSGDLNFVRWRMQPNGWLRLDYRYNLSGPQQFMGVNFDYPEKQVTGVKWLGQGPYRVWKNRLRGAARNVWAKDYNDSATGEGNPQYPEFKGYHADVSWLQLRTNEAPITVVAAQDDLFVRLFTPRDGVEAGKAAGRFPAGDLSFLDGIAPIGTKFHTPEELGPQSQPNAGAPHSRTLFFYFGELETPKN